MYITLSPNQSLADTNAKFQNLFGLLKLNFFMNQHNAGQGSSDGSLIPTDTLWSELNLKIEMKIEFSKETKVSEFEAYFNDLAIGVQVLRNSKGTWLQTSATDSWTLAEQQVRAQELNEGTNDIPEMGDYHEQE